MNSSLIVGMFVVGNILGSGFFMIPSVLAPLGSNLIYSWMIAFFIAIVFCLIFSRLFLLFPKVRSLSDYFKQTSNRKIVAVAYWISCIIGNAGIVITLMASLGVQSKIALISAMIMFLVTLANDTVNYHTVEKIESLLTILKFGILVVLPIGLFVWQPDVFVFRAPAGNAMSITKIGITAFWAFLGIESAVFFGSGKQAVRGLIGGVLACSLLYVFSSLFIVGCVDLDTLRNSCSPFSLFVAKFFGNGYERYANFLIAFTVFGALYGWIAATGKMSIAFAQSELFPKQFLKQTNSKNSSLGLWSSSIATWLVFFFCSKYDVVSQFSIVADGCIYITLAIYAACAYVLWTNAKKFHDVLLGIFGIIVVIFSCVIGLISYL